MLAAKGLLSRQHGRGTFITQADMEPAAKDWLDTDGDAEEYQEYLLEFRELLECGAAELAAIRHTKKDSDRLIIALNAAEEAWLTTNRNDQIQTDISLHYCIAQATHNPIFGQLMSSLNRILLKNMQLSIAGYHDDSDVTSAVRAQHKKLVDAILDRNPDAARRASEIHLEYVRVRLNHLTKSQYLK